MPLLFEGRIWYARRSLEVFDMRAFTLALALVITACSPARVGPASEVAVHGAAQYDALVWSPLDADIEDREADSFILLVTRGGDDEAQFQRYGSAAGYAVRGATEDDFRANHPIVVAEQSGGEDGGYLVQHRSRDHRAIVRFYVELMVAEGEVSGSEFQVSFLASVM